jgi:hypothetical protein
LLLFGLALGCSKSGQSKSQPSTPSQATPKHSSPPQAKSQAATDELTFTGMCDASAGVPLDERYFVVADDEDNVLRAYDTTAPGPPVWSVDVSTAIGVFAKRKKPGKAPPETDIEAATRVGELAFWMTSHGRNSSGKLKRERLRLFATSVPKAGQPLRVVGKPYEHLLEDFLAEPRLERFGLRAAAELAPKVPGGLNLEGMTARREGGVWIGFRNPIPDGKALLVPLLNPEQLIQGAKAVLGEPLQLDLGGYGVRAISSQGGRYLILAGAFDGGGTTRLYAWDGTGAAQVVAGPALAGLNGEGFFSPGGERVLVLSDDGSVVIDGEECKRLDDVGKKRFRARWIKP